jgi:hypothetical protein
MKRSRDGGEQDPKREMVFIVCVNGEGDVQTCSVELTEEEIALLVPRFVRSTGLDRCTEVEAKGPAAEVLHQIYFYAKGMGGDLYEKSAAIDVSTVDIANTRARTIVWFDWIN